ncbi:MAG: hypothetical protein F6K53_35335 [Moorea sp. SIO4A1]|uniref:GUN4 domain-containing protein n=1 Tax=Moorena sp. SIO4A1 TaxID=2607835 RepID=UPI00144FD10B|nr:GUN4 domain-containing protein [Moorena sp. SIO4A1]NEQ62387.1 hypothetical protein [Moorena sp. SIO4A1]
MYELSGIEFKELLEAIINAYPRAINLEIAVRVELEKNLKDIAGGENNSDIAFNLIRDAEAKGYIEKLIDGLYNQNSGNSQLSSIYNKLKLKFANPSNNQNNQNNPNNKKKVEEIQPTTYQSTQRPKPEIYQHLNDLLEKKKWVESNEETFAIMNKIIGRNTRLSWKTKNIKECPCHVLCHIDKLWRQYSNNCFGFTVQKKIWEEKCTTKNDREKEFGRHVGWYDDWRKEWLSRSNQIFTENLEKNLDNKEKYQGILPTLTSKNYPLEDNASLIPYLVNKLKSCNCDSCD